MVLWKGCTQNSNKFGKLSSGHRTGKGQFSFQSQRKARPKNAQTTTQLHSSHMLKVMLKILQARLQQYVNLKFPDVQARFRKGRGTRNQIATSAGSSKKQESSRKIPISALLTIPNPLNVWIQKTGKFLKRWEYQTTWPASWKSVCRYRNNS